MSRKFGTVPWTSSYKKTIIKIILREQHSILWHLTWNKSKRITSSSRIRVDRKWSRWCRTAHGIRPQKATSGSSLFVSGEERELGGRLQVVLVVLRSEQLRLEQNLSHLHRRREVRHRSFNVHHNGRGENKATVKVGPTITKKKNTLFSIGTAQSVSIHSLTNVWWKLTPNVMSTTAPRTFGK